MTEKEIVLSSDTRGIILAVLAAYWLERYDALGKLREKLAGRDLSSEVAPQGLSSRDVLNRYEEEARKAREALREFESYCEKLRSNDHDR